MRLTKEYLGIFDATIENGDLIVGQPNTIKLTYTVGKYGIDDGGYIWFIRHGVTDWQGMNFTKEEALGYTTVKTNANVELFVESVDTVRPYETGIRIRVKDGCLKEGDKVELTLGDTSKGSLGMVVQTVAEKNHVIFAAIDSVGSGRYVDINQPVYFEVKNGMPSDFHVTLPSNIEPNVEGKIRIRVLDAYGNRCEDFVGAISIIPWEGLEIEENVEFTKYDLGCKEIPFVAKEIGVFRLSCFVNDYDIEFSSNPCKVKDFTGKKLYWGDMHGQNLLGSGIGSMDDVLTFSKDVAMLDFTGWQGNDFEVSDCNWDIVKKAVKKYHKDGEYVVFLGYEWSGITANGGDHNIYYKGDDGEIHRSSRWLCKEEGERLVKGQIDDGSDCNPITELWDRFEGRNDVLAIPHVGGRYGNFDFFNPKYTPAIEMYSHHGIFEWYIEDAIKKGMKVGFLATSDDHTSRVGLSYPTGSNESDIGATFDVRSGVTGLYAKELTRDGIWEALKKRSCYAATSSRMILEYSCNGYEMGEEFYTEETPKLDINIYGSAPLSHIDIYRNLEMIHREFIGAKKTESKTKEIKIVWSGVRTKFRKKSVTWDGAIYFNGAVIQEAKDYSIDNPFDGIQGQNNHIISFKSKTSGDEDGMIVKVLPIEECATLSFTSKQGTFSCCLSEITEDGKIFDMGGLNCKVEVYLVEREENQFDGGVVFEDKNVENGLNNYYIKAYQADGNRLWSSPIFVNYKNTGEGKEKS